MEFLQAFEAPIVEIIHGAKVEFPVLQIDDFTPWISEIVAARKSMARQQLNKVMAATPSATQNLGDPLTRWRLEQDIESLDLGLEVVADAINTVPGSKRVLQLSMTKAGIPEKDQAEVLKRILPRRLHRLAADVSGLFEKKTPKPAQATPANGGNIDPNSGSPVTGASAGENGIG